MSASLQLATKYLIFALFATAVNIATQAAFVALYHGPYALPVSVLLGTVTGLAVKYYLDKHYIFAFHTRSASHNSQIFMLYTLVGGLTTIIFWGFEFGFAYVYKTEAMKYLGAVIGLAIGYVCKYQLDKRYVFNEARQ